MCCEEKGELIMQNFIIDPQVFYWINVLGIMQTVLAIFGAINICVAIGFIIAWVYNHVQYTAYDCEDNKEYAAICKKISIITGLIGTIMIVLSIFIPGKTTSIEMLVAKTATFDNVNWTVQQVKEVVDYIVKALQSV